MPRLGFMGQYLSVGLWLEGFVHITAKNQYVLTCITTTTTPV